MATSKLIILLRTLTHIELKNFGKFLNSPYHNTNPSLVLLYDYLCKYYPDFPEKPLRKAKVFKKLFPDRTYTVKKMYHLISLFSLSLEQFLTISQLQKQPLVQQRLMLTALSEHPVLYPLFSKKINAVQSEQKNSACTNATDFYHLFELHRLFFQHPQTLGPQPDLEHLQETLHLLDNYYELSKFRLVEKVLATEHSNQKETSPACLFTEAYCHFYKKELDAALEKLFQIDHAAFYAHRIRTLEIQILYEKYVEDQTYLQLLRSKLKAYDTFLTRCKEVNSQELEALRNMKRWIRRLVCIREKTAISLAVQHELLTELQNLPSIVAYTWLREKVLELVV